MFETRKYPISRNGNIQSLERKGEQEISNYALLIDNLEYSYQTNSNKLLNIKDLTGLSFGYHDQHTSSTTPDFEYDDFGNLIKDRDKKINAIVYNHSNLPLKITFDGGEVIEYVYLSDGTKFKKTVSANSVTTTTDYVDGFQYTNGILDFFPHAEGYVKYNSNNIANIYSYVFHHTDHLGNIRLRYTRHPRTGNLAILEENHYYPFGLTHSGYNSNHQVFSFEDNVEIDLIPVTPNAADAYRYKYNGKEFQDELGLNVYDYGARIYTPDAPRFWQMDPLAEADKNIGYSPYVYAINNPISYIDPDGRCWQKVGESYVPCDDASVGSTTTGAFGNSWTMTESNGWQLTNGADPSKVNYQYDYIEPTGDKSYYTDRYKNHIEKYNTRPPDYYLEYGYNNKALFDKTYPSMSDIGKEIFDKIGPGLQEAMNKGIKNNPSMQGNDQEFKDFAYNSHFPVYKESGIGRLGGDDLLRMISVPKWKDTFGSPEGRSLIKKLFPVLFSDRPRNPDLWNPQKNPGLKRPGEY